MNSITKHSPVGVIGSGTFGTAVANLLAENRDVILYSRRPEVIADINNTGKNRKQDINPRITPTNKIEEITEKCSLIFPIVSSANFRETMQKFSPFLRPRHLLIHGTKGFDVQLKPGEKLDAKSTLGRSHVSTMSEIILQETVVMRVGCLAGPNLAMEIADKQPAATVISSRFDEVIKEGKDVLKSSRFQVYGSHDLTGIEIAGVLKNVIAIAAGILNGLGFGENIKALLISRGLGEMIYLGKMLGGDRRSFFGLAGVGDLIATCYSPRSRNFTVGYRLAKGETIEEIMSTMEEKAEGVNTLKISNAIVNYYKIHAPITETLYKILFMKLPPREGLQYLMDYPFIADVDYL